jgi:type III secretion system YscD/HrpQ family protein
MVATFTAEDGPLKGLVLTLDDEGTEWTIGRDPDESTLLIEDPLASRKHLHCTRTSSGFIVENLSHTNPVLINDVELTEPTLLKNDDKLKIGDCTYVFHEDAPAEELVELPEDSLFEDDEPESPEENRDTIFEEDDGKATFAEINFGMINSGRWLLKVISGPNSGAEFSMQSDSSHIIGTDPNIADIVFHDTSVSRQHLKITVGADNTITVEDLQSRNGTLVDGEQIKEKRVLPLNTTVTLGTTTFVIYDRESEMKTIISPLLPSIFKALQKEETQKEEAAEAAKAQEAMAPAEEKRVEQSNTTGLIIIGIITGIFVIAGIGISSLFKQETVEVVQDANADEEVAKALAQFPSIKPFFTASTGKLYLVGHILNNTERNQLMYNLQGLKFIKEIDDSGVVVDEFVWQEINQIINKNPNWKGINIYAAAPGKFILTGYLQTRKQAELLSDYITANFPYPDLLEKRVVVEEDVVSSVSSALLSAGFKNVVVQLANGELSLTGVIPRGKQQDFDAVLTEIKKNPGIRNLRNFVTEVAPEATLINISDKYEVTGYSKTGTGKVNVVINGRILSKEDNLDGMVITEIRPNAVLLEKDGVRYRIDFNK